MEVFCEPQTPHESMVLGATLKLYPLTKNAQTKIKLSLVHRKKRETPPPPANGSPKHSPGNVLLNIFKAVFDQN